MTSRLSPSGLQGILGLKLDLTTFGKYLGGGLAFGAFGSRADIMAVYNPRSPNALAHSGTFNSNTLVMYAVFAGLSQVWTPEVAVEFNKLGDYLRVELERISEDTKMSVTGRGSIMGIHFSANGVRVISSREDIEEDWGLENLFFMESMEDGFWITKRGSIELILGTPRDELDRFVECVERFLERHPNLIDLRT